MRFRLAAVLAVLLVTACSSHPPTAQLQSFSDAYKSANDAGQPILDELAVAEKSEGKYVAEKQAGRPNLSGNLANERSDVSCPRSQQRWLPTGDETGFIQGYCVKDAPYFATVGEPPATQAFRGGLAVLGKYVDVLIFLAEGRNIEELHAQLQSLSSNIGQLLAFVPGAGPAAPAISGALTALQGPIDAAAQEQNDREVRRLVLQGAPAAEELIEKLKGATPAIFNVLTAASARTISTSDSSEVVKLETTRIEAYRVTVSNFVVLLSGLEIALGELVEAVKNPDQAASLESLADETANLRIYADAVSKDIAALHRSR